MHLEVIWEWLDAVDQDNLDPLDQFGVPPPAAQFDHVAPRSDGEPCQQYEKKDITESKQPAGILLRTGSIRRTGENYKVFERDVEHENRPQALVPGFHANATDNKERKDATNPKVTRQHSEYNWTRQLQNLQLHTSGRDGNNGPTKRKPLPNFADRASGRGNPGTRLSDRQSNVEVEDPVAVSCRGAKVVGECQKRYPQDIGSTTQKGRRNTTTGDQPLHRSNAFKRPSNVRPALKVRPIKEEI